MSSSLDNEKDLTLLVPSETSLRAMPKATLGQLTSNQSEARNFVLRHTLAGRRMALGYQPSRAALKAGQVMTGGDKVSRRITPKGGRLVIGEAAIEVGDIEINNGVIHIIDAPLNVK